MASDVSNAVRRLRRLGYQVEQSKRNGHWHVRKDGRLVTVLSETTRNRRILQDLKANLRESQRGTA